MKQKKKKFFQEVCSIVVNTIFGACFGLSTRMEYFSKCKFRHSILGLSLISIY